MHFFEPIICVNTFELLNIFTQKANMRGREWRKKFSQLSHCPQTHHPVTAAVQQLRHHQQPWRAPNRRLSASRAVWPTRRDIGYKSTADQLDDPPFSLVRPNLYCPTGFSNCLQNRFSPSVRSDSSSLFSFVSRFSATNSCFQPREEFWSERFTFLSRLFDSHLVCSGL